MEHELAVHAHSIAYHKKSNDGLDMFAYYFVKLLARTMDIVFGTRYGHRAVVLETIAAVPGMVGGMINHLRCLRMIRDDRGWIHALLEEAENERMHLMIYSHIARPNVWDKIMIFVTQAIFYVVYTTIYIVSDRTAHRIVGYFEEEAIHSYTKYLALVDAGIHHNIVAPDIAIRYWNLLPEAKLRDVIIATRNDEIVHRDVNHKLADTLEHRL